MAEINVSKLNQELKNASIKISGCDSNGTVWDMAGKQIQDRSDVLLVVGAHDPTPPISEIRQEEYNKVGVNSKSMLSSLWKKIMSSDSSDADALQALIDEVNASID